MMFVSAVVELLNPPMLSRFTRYITPCLPPEKQRLVPGISSTPAEPRSVSFCSRVRQLKGANELATFKFVPLRVNFRKHSTRLPADNGLVMLVLTPLATEM